MSRSDPVRNLVVVLGDQLNAESAAFDGFDRGRDIVFMAEVAGEARHVWSHKARIALFLSAMRHFRDDRVAQGMRVDYRELDAADNSGELAAELGAAIDRHCPAAVVLAEPGEWRVGQAIEAAANNRGIDFELRPDRRFLCSREEFAAHARGRKQLRLEYFYRELRRRHGVLMDGDEPVGGKWNFDRDNRGAFGSSGPDELPAPIAFERDATTREVLALVEREFPDHPGRLDDFDWPVTPDEARHALDDFIAQRLGRFGDFQDAMWSGEPWLYHSLISAALNLGLLDPRAAIEAAEAAWREGKVPLNAAEGFIRQILGWREYVRGIYWHEMPGYIERNALDARAPLPAFYWTAETDMNCLRQTIAQTLDYGYAHHIQRLMVTGLYALLLGVDPRAVHEWYLGVYVDAVEWVELPNSLGMSQFADGGLMASKPYVASGKYIQRMSNYCQGCSFDPAKATGEGACPFTTLYWDFLRRHRQQLASNSRMRLQLANLDRKSAAELDAIRGRAATLRDTAT